MSKLKVNKFIQSVVKYGLVIFICILVLFPLYWMFVTAISPELDTFSATPHLFPRILDITGFKDLVETGMILSWLKNTLIVAITTSLVCVFVSTLSGYTLSRFNYRGGNAFGLLLLVTQMLPEALIIVPVYGIFQALGLLNTHFALVLINSAINIPIGTWILKNYIDTIPKELDEAALVDGCTKTQTLFKIILPNVLPSLVAVGVIVFFEAWNEYMFASTFITKQINWVTSVGLASFIGMYTVPVTQIMAGAIIFCVPALIFYLIFQRHIISGMTSGAVKG